MISHPDKILFPKARITKQDLANYYLKVAKWMIPLIKDRPISLQRYPQGISKPGFFQKNVPDYLPSWIKTASIKKGEQGKMRMLLCNDTKTLMWLVNQCCITPHIWLSSFDKPLQPDRIVFDLDPGPSARFNLVRAAAKKLRHLLETKWKLAPLLATTGSRGLHVVIPIKRELSFNQVRMFAKQIAMELVSLEPSLCTLAARKLDRRGKIYIDIVRNSYAQTVVAPFAVRANAKAGIAMPITWQELDKPGFASDYYNLTKKPLKLKNLWTNWKKKQISIKKFIK